MTALHFALHATPIEDVIIVVSGPHIIELHPLRESIEHAVARLSMRYDAPVIEHSSAPANAARKQLDEYFAGRRRAFSLPLHWDGVHGFARAALEAVCTIPYGETAGYGEVAVLAGSPRAARAVGTACATTPFSIVVPVHRVVRADGSLGEYGGHPEVKARLIDLERSVMASADMSVG